MEFEETFVDLANLNDFYSFLEDVVIENTSGEKIDGDFSNIFMSFNSRLNVKRIQIEFSSQLLDCRILENFPNLDTVCIYADTIKSLKGLESLTKLSYLTLEFNRGKTFDYSVLAKLSLDKFEINNINTKEKEILSDGLFAREIKIVGHDNIGDLSYLKNTGVVDLTIGHGKFINLEGLEKLKCKRLELNTCKNFSTILTSKKLDFKDLDFVTCNKINFDSISKVVNCKNLHMTMCKPHFNLSSIFSINKIENVVLNNTGVVLDFENINLKNSTLSDVYISPISKSDFKKIKKISNRINWSC